MTKKGGRNDVLAADLVAWRPGAFRTSTTGGGSAAAFRVCRGYGPPPSSRPQLPRPLLVRALHRYRSTNLEQTELRHWHMTALPRANRRSRAIEYSTLRLAVKRAGCHSPALPGSHLDGFPQICTRRPETIHCTAHQKRIEHYLRTNG